MDLRVMIGLLHTHLAEDKLQVAEHARERMAERRLPIDCISLAIQFGNAQRTPSNEGYDTNGTVKYQSSLYTVVIAVNEQYSVVLTVYSTTTEEYRKNNEWREQMLLTRQNSKNRHDSNTRNIIAKSSKAAKHKVKQRMLDVNEDEAFNEWDNDDE